MCELLGFVGFVMQPILFGLKVSVHFILVYITFHIYFPIFIVMYVEYHFKGGIGLVITINNSQR